MTHKPTAKSHPPIVHRVPFPPRSLHPESIINNHSSLLQTSTHTQPHTDTHSSSPAPVRLCCPPPLLLSSCLCSFVIQFLRHLPHSPMSPSRFAIFVSLLCSNQCPDVPVINTLKWSIPIRNSCSCAALRIQKHSRETLLLINYVLQQEEFMQSRCAFIPFHPKFQTLTPDSLSHPLSNAKTSPFSLFFILLNIIEKK